MDCETVQSRLLDYLEHALPTAEQAALESHLVQCNACRAEHDSLIAVIATTRNNPTPQPGDAYWQAFPDQVLAAFKTQSKPTAPIEAKPSWWSSLLAGWRQTTWYGVAVPAVLAAIAITISFYWYPASDAPQVNSLVFQQQLRSQTQFAVIVKEYGSRQHSDNYFAFAGDAASNNYFRSGTLYSETLALLAGQDVVAAKTHFAVLNKSLANQLPTLSKALERINEMFTAKAEPHQILSSLGRLQLPLEQAARSSSRDQKTLFQFGSWLSDIKLALMVNPEMLPSQTVALEYFINNLQLAPRGVKENLRQLQTLFRSQISTSTEQQQVLQLINNIQLVLG